ncbi:type I-F CRISPR-associated protein Csy1 [Photorhabdus stackebrandtii]|uniref:Type I-F CRISPR-associated protein Csy1 n=1 Tax=Photorhabdus stackebrandtii TaxID=1123042 RepID=A0A7X5TM21_9GAMM|nr:type I-F CRISPR-associated protein Csy1 [Photorhabdus stackebrandtii]NHB97024.1 type I-F CRISPR-associated protein Csy1 [Photorhabdus stackebrandtii]
MNENGLSRFIVDYIESRKQSKLEAFDKEVEKKLAKLTSAEEISVAQQEIAEQLKELEERFEVRNWLDDAANRAKQISLVTHALKFTHSDAKGSSIFATSASGKENIEYLSITVLNKPAIDAVGNAAALDVAKLLQTEYQKDSLVECLNREDYTALAELAESEQQLERWINGFRQALSDETLSSHKLAKQLYFPVSPGEYHLLSPLFSSSLANAIHQHIIEARFGESSKEINKAKKEEYWHPEARVIYPSTAVQNIGGTKPQNISYLNSVRGGSTWLLSCASPNWLSITKPPMERRSIFDRRSEFVSLARETIGKMRQYLFVVQDIENNRKIKKLRQEFVDQIIDILFNYVAGIQNLFELKGWSASDDCELKRAQQLWLDPYRCQLDKEFRFEREGGDWKKEIAADFSYWLNQSLKHERLEMELPERREWASEFKKRLREFEDELPEVMP